ncbi:MAG: hypothetical protein IJ042_02585 [Butyricicoccus sp.]|nr:hypothetical protein [Butyricicoccus sp.]
MSKHEKILYIATPLSFLAFAFQFIPFLFAPSWYIWDANIPPNIPTLLYHLLFGIVMGIHVICILLSAALGIRAFVNRPKTGMLLRVLLGIYPILTVLFFLGDPSMLLYYCGVPLYMVAGVLQHLFLLIF